MSSAAPRGHICMRIIFGDLICPTDTRIVIDLVTAPWELDR
jgi:hypothetical protein